MPRTRPGVNREPSGRSRGRVSRAFALTTASGVDSTHAATRISPTHSFINSEQQA